MLFRNIILATALLLSAGIAGAAELLSPDGNVKLTFDLTAQGEPMEYVTVARKAKNSDDWFVGCSNGIEPRVSEIDFSFLPAKNIWPQSTATARTPTIAMPLRTMS